MADGTAISEHQYVRVSDGRGSPSIRTKLSSSGRAVTPLNVLLQDPAMELSTACQKKSRGFNKQFQRMLSQGKGVSVFEVVRQERQKAGETELPLADQTFLSAKDSDGFTILHHAARCNQAETINLLLDNGGVDIDQVENMGFTALHVAVRHKSTEAVKVLLQRGADPIIPDNENVTPLLFAARQAYIEIASLLLNDPRTNVNYGNSAKITPFLSACASGDKSLCELLLARGAELTAKSSNLTTALHCAAYGGHVEICELLISTAKKLQLSLNNFLEERDVEDTTALHISCCKGDSGVTELLIRHGVDYEAVKGVNSSSPLHLSAMHGHDEITKLLISSGATVDSRNGHLKTPLHQAAIFNQTKIAKILLENGACIEAKNMMDMTPFLIAVVYGSKEIAEMLLDRGADLMAVESARNSGLHLAVIHRRVEILQMLLERSKGELMDLRNNDLRTVIHLAACHEDPEILDILLAQKFTTEQRDINNKIPLHHAAENGSLECIKSLLRCQMLLQSLNDRDDHGMTPLHLASLNKRAEASGLLICKGGDTTTQDHNQSTPLHLAVKAGSLEVVQLLLNTMLPSTLEIKDVDQNTPLHIACMYNRLDVLKLLLDKGAEVSARNKDDMTCLDVAIEWDSLEVAKTLVKHERWKEVVSASSKDQIPPMEKLIQKLPEVAEMVLDQCISYCQRPTSHPDFTVTFNFSLLDPLDVLSNGRYFFGPGSMATYRRESLLKHCVTQALLKWKWLVLGKFFNYLNFALFFVFLVLFSFFIVDQRSKVRLSFNSEVVTTIGKDESKAISGVIFAFGILKILSEIIQLIWLQRHYFKDYTNFLDVAMHASALIYIFPYVTKDDLYGDAEVQWTAGALALLLIYVNMILSLRRLSSVAIYVTMYVEVLVTFIKVIAIFCIVLIGYALVFHVLLKEEDNFSSVGLSFVKIFVMMVGEMDYSDMLTSNVVSSAKVPGTNIPYVPLPELSYIMFMLLVLSVSIILMNLLVGLAVGDIDSIQKTASLRNLIDEATLVDDIQRRYPKWILRYAYKDFLEIQPNQNQFIKKIAFSGTGFTDSELIDSLRKRQSSVADDDQDLDNYDQQRYERQEERIKNLQATVDAQSELLKAIADKLNIGK